MVIMSYVGRAMKGGTVPCSMLELGHVSDHWQHQDKIVSLVGKMERNLYFILLIFHFHYNIRQLTSIEML